MSDPRDPDAHLGPDPEPEGERDDLLGASRIRKLGRRLMGQERVSAREVVGAVMEGGDKAKTELVRVVAREVRAYLEELGLREVLTDYSLEVRASINLRKLTEAEKEGPGERHREPAKARPSEGT